MQKKEVYIKTKDYFLTGEAFSVIRAGDGEPLMTDPVPPAGKLQDYYPQQGYISHHSASQSITGRLYFSVRNIRNRYKLKLISRHAGTGGTLLDIGCGTGSFLHAALQKGYRVSGVEPSPVARKNLIPEIDTVSIYQNITEIPPGSRFDIITLWHVLEHIPDIHEYLLQIKKLLHDDARLFLALPDYKSEDARYYGKYWAAWDVPRHVYHFSKDDITNQMHKYGFTLEKYYPMKWDAYYISLLSESYKTGKKRWIPALYRGLLSNLKARHTGEYSSMLYVFKML